MTCIPCGLMTQRDVLNNSLNNLFTHSFTSLLTYSFIYLFTSLTIHSLIYLLTYLLTQLILLHLFTHSLPSSRIIFRLLMSWSIFAFSAFVACEEDGRLPPRLREAHSVRELRFVRARAARYGTPYSLTYLLTHSLVYVLTYS